MGVSRIFVAAAAVALALAVVGGASARPVCTELGCVRAVDVDGDGVPDGVVAALAAAERVNLNAYVFADGTWTNGGVVIVDDHDDQFHFVDAYAYSGHVASDGSPGFDHAGVDVLVYEADGHTGRSRLVAHAGVGAHDHDGDGVPDEAHAILP